MKIKYNEFKTMVDSIKRYSYRNDCGGERARRIVAGILTQDVNVEMPKELYKEIKDFVENTHENNNWFGRKASICSEADYM